MADNDQSSTTDTGVEEPTKSTEQKQDSKPEVPETRTDSAGSDDGQSDEGDDAGSPGAGEGEDSTPTKKENQLGYRIRQLTSSNPMMQRLQERLQPWVDDTSDPTERRFRQGEINNYVDKAARAQDDIRRDNEQVVRDIPIFNPSSSEFKPELARRAYAQYARDMAIEDQNGATDVNGNPVIVGYRMRLIDFMHEKAEDYGFGSVTQKSDKQKPKSNAKAKMDAAADAPGGTSAASRKTGKDEKDPFLAGFDDPYGRYTPKNAHAWSERA